MNSVRPCSDIIFAPNRLESQPLRVALELIFLIGSFTMLGFGGYYGGITGLALKITGSCCSLLAMIRVTRMAFEECSNQPTRTLPSTPTPSPHATTPIQSALDSRRWGSVIYKCDNQEFALYQPPHSLRIAGLPVLHAVFTVNDTSYPVIGVFLDRARFPKLPENMEGFRWLQSQEPRAEKSWYQDGLITTSVMGKRVWQWCPSPKEHSDVMAHIHCDDFGFHVFTKNYDQTTKEDQQPPFDPTIIKYYFELPQNSTAASNRVTQEIQLSGCNKAFSLSYCAINGMKNAYLLLPPTTQS